MSDEHNPDWDRCWDEPRIRKPKESDPDGGDEEEPDSDQITANLLDFLNHSEENR